MKHDFSSRSKALMSQNSSVWSTHYLALQSKEAGQEVYLLSVGDSDFNTHQTIIDTATQALCGGDTHYTEVLGRESLRNLISDQHQKNTGQYTDNTNIAILAGAQCALYATAQCLFEQGDHVLVLEPAYVSYDAVIKATGAEITYVPPMNDGSFRLDIEALQRSITPQTKAILFSSPNNPSGLILKPDELQALASLAKKHQLWVIADEVYRDLIFEGHYHPFSRYAFNHDMTVIISSVSKSHTMTGWRCGWVVTSSALIKHIENLALCMLYGLPGFIQQAAEYGLSHSDHIVEPQKALYRSRRDLAVNLLQTALGEQCCVVPEAGMFLLLDIKPTKLDGLDFSRKLYQQYRVSVLDGSAFGSATVGYIRLSFAIAENELTEALTRLVKFYKEHANASV